jgi:transposase
MDTVLKRGSRSGRLNYPRSFKLKVAVEACTPGISVSQLALHHQLNANMVFKWRREYLAGLFAGDDTEESALLPVVVVASQNEPSVALPAPAPRCQRGGIVIEIGGAVVRIDGMVDADILRLVIASLRA